MLKPLLFAAAVVAGALLFTALFAALEVLAPTPPGQLAAENL